MSWFAITNFGLLKLMNQFLLDVQHSCSVADEFRAKTHHRDTENTEVAQRILRTRTFSAKPIDAHLAGFNRIHYLRKNFRLSPIIIKTDDAVIRISNWTLRGVALAYASRGRRVGRVPRLAQTCGATGAHRLGSGSNNSEPPRHGRNYF